jgi:uncharacterized protein involved in outer membrane biogenesis
MSRILKLLGIVVGAAILLFGAVLVIVCMLFDPNDYKPTRSSDQSTSW